MKVKITKGFGWYEDLVGEVFDVAESDSINGFLRYYVDPRGFSGRRFIRAENCEIVSEDESKGDAVNHPNHYQNGRFETIEMIEEITKGYADGFVAYSVGNALKYLSRAPFKHGEPTEDIRKAAKYLEFAIEYLTKEGE